MCVNRVNWVYHVCFFQENLRFIYNNENQEYEIEKNVNNKWEHLKFINEQYISSWGKRYSWRATSQGMHASVECDKVFNDAMVPMISYYFFFFCDIF